MCTKQELRRLIRQRKAAMPHEQLQAMSEVICRQVMASLPWHEADTLLLYHSLPDEVDTAMLIREAETSGKQVLLPVVVGDVLELRSYEGPHSLQSGPYGILEPTGPLFLPAEYGRISLAVVPGMAFDDDGHRLGRGRGYYDKLLPLLVSACKMGICWQFQMLDQVPSVEHDVVMNCVVHN